MTSNTEKIAEYQNSIEKFKKSKEVNNVMLYQKRKDIYDIVLEQRHQLLNTLDLAGKIIGGIAVDSEKILYERSLLQIQAKTQTLIQMQLAYEDLATEMSNSDTSIGECIHQILVLKQKQKKEEEEEMKSKMQ